MEPGIDIEEQFECPVVELASSTAARLVNIIMLITVMPETSRSSTLTPQSHFTRRTSSLVCLKPQR
ncbi:hypothetical protein NC652_009590 [Populus alba x Populus x berolinensis]|nr:hypothetical protein NC652_009590 [Populus alba x Populus x berolinensis]